MKTLTKILIIFVIICSFISCSTKTENKKADFFEDIKSTTKVNLKPLIDISSVEKVNSLNSRFENNTTLKNYEQFALDGSTVHPKGKLNNGLKERISFAYGDNTYIDMWLWNTKDLATTNFNFLLKDTDLKISKYDNDTKKCYIQYTDTNQLYEISIQLENIFIFIKAPDGKYNSSDINKVISILKENLSSK